MRILAALAMSLAAGLTACGEAAAPSTAANHTTTAMRHAAVRLVFADVNATALPRAYDRAVLQRRMSRYVASAWRDQRAARVAAAITRMGGQDYTQPWNDAITVGRWVAENSRGRDATVVFLAYETVTVAREPAVDRPLTRFTVRMYRERGRWRLITYDKDWLTPAGPMEQSGADTIDSLPERVVFHNPRN